MLPESVLVCPYGITARRSVPDNGVAVYYGVAVYSYPTSMLPSRAGCKQCCRLQGAHQLGADSSLIAAGNTQPTHMCF